MLYNLSSEDRQRLGSITKQIRAKIGDTDCRLAAAVYAIFVCQCAKKATSLSKDLAQAFNVKLPEYLEDVYVTDYLLNSGNETTLEKQPLVLKVKRLIKDLAQANESSIDLLSVDKDKLMTEWLEKSVEKLQLQVYLLENVAHPVELISQNVSLPAEVFNVLIKTSESATDQVAANTIPADLAGIVAKAFPLQPGDSALDLCFGVGNMISSAMKVSEGVAFYGQEADPLSALLGWLRIQLLPSDNTVSVKVGDALTHSFESKDNTRPINLAYVYGSSISTSREDSRTSKSFDAEMVEKALKIKRYNRERLEHSAKAITEAEREIILKRKSDRLTHGITNEIAEKNRQEMRMLEEKHKELSNLQSLLEKEYFDSVKALRALRPQNAFLHLYTAENRDTKLINHAIDTVDNAGTVVATVSSRNLFNSNSLRLFKEYLNPVKNFLDTVVELPRGSAGTNDRMAILVFRKKRKTTDILFVDATNINTVTKSSSDTNDVDVGEVATSSVFRRTKASDFPEDYVSRLVDIIKNRLECNSVSVKVPVESLFEKLTDLRPQKYLVASSPTKESVESLQQSLFTATQRSFQAANALRASRMALGLEPLNTFTSIPNTAPKRLS